MINDSLKITAEHPILIKRSNKWKFVRTWEIQVNDKLYTLDQTELNVDTIINVTDTWLNVCVIDVEELDNYFAGNILAHNGGKGFVGHYLTEPSGS